MAKIELFILLQLLLIYNETLKLQKDKILGMKIKQKKQTMEILGGYISRNMKRS